MLQWNIWHGGVHLGNDGPDRIIELIRSCRADIVTMQEAYGSQEKIAQALNFQLQTASSHDNLALYSRFFIHHLQSSEIFKSNPALITLPNKREILVNGCWLYYAYRPEYIAGYMNTGMDPEVWVKEDDKETKTVFTGDLGNNDIPLLSPLTMIEDTDYLVMESTYGSRLHVKNEQKAEIFLNVVSETLDNGGTVVIPSFAVGRTQEILYELNKLKEEKEDEEFIRKYKILMKTPVYVDSPLAISATEVFSDNMDLFDEETKEEMAKGDNPLEFPGLQFTKTADESKALNEDPRASIIISASGMCEVGRIKHHLKHNLWNPKSTILFVGYQAPGTLGYNIVNGAKTVKIFGEEIAVNARIEYIEGYSGHADQELLMNFIYSFIKKPKHIFLVHGEPESQDILRDKIESDTGLGVTIPEFGETYELKDDILLTNKIHRKVNKNLKVEVSERIEKIKEELKDMENYVKQDIQDENLRNEDIFRINEKIKDLEKQILNVIEG